MDIYIKPVKKVSLVGVNAVCVNDLAQVTATDGLAEKIKDLIIFEPEMNKKACYLISVMNIIQRIQTAYPEHTVNNVGEIDTLVDFSPKLARDNLYWKWAKIIFVIIVLLTGSATAIMSFHNDAQIPKVLQNYYKMFFGEENDKPLILYIPYSIGLTIGISTFFNHFVGKKITNDPTPIEVEMRRYDGEVTNTIIKALQTKSDKND